jgi:hypothetical protein
MSDHPADADIADQAQFLKPVGRQFTDPEYGQQA